MRPRTTPVAVAASVVAAAATLIATTTTPASVAAPPGSPPVITGEVPPPSAAPSAIPPAQPASEGTTAGVIGIDDVVDVGDAKPARRYDPYLAAALADVESWWAGEFPRVYAEPFDPLEGGIFAAYPERTAPIPSCGGNNPTSSYQEVSDFGAFYCRLGDFMAYDDGDEGVLYGLAERYGAAVVAVVMAHEYGHAVQARLGERADGVPTVVSEQQADCFAGAWSRRAWSGQAPGLSFTDDDVRTGLIALVLVRDPVGTNLFEEGGHGSAFDRIGAYQHGFLGGVDACANLLEDPLPLLPNLFNPADVDDEATQGNLPFGYANHQIMGVIQDDLIRFWPAELAPRGAAVPLIQLRPASDPAVADCADAAEVALTSAQYCAATNEVLFDEGQARVMYDDFGDFAVGYAIGHAWADGVQSALGLSLTGERRSLVSDCLVGAWVSAAIRPPDDFVGTTTTSPLHPDRTLTMSPGDLDEAVQTALVIGDRRLGDDVRGSAFEKIAYLRIGVLDGVSRCLTEAERLAGAEATGGEATSGAGSAAR